jgi:hypothetical protein
VTYGVLPVVNNTKSSTLFSDYSFLAANQLAKALKNTNAQANLNIQVFGPTELEAKAKQLGLLATYQKLMIDYRYQREPDLETFNTLLNGFKQGGINLEGLFFVDTDLDFSNPFGRRGLDYPVQTLFQLPPKDAQYKITVHTELFKPSLNTASVWQNEATSWINHDDLPGVASSIYFDGQTLRFFNAHTSKLSQELLSKMPLQLLTPMAKPQQELTLAGKIVDDSNRLIKKLLPDAQPIKLPYQQTRQAIWAKTKSMTAGIIEVLPPIIQLPINTVGEFINGVNSPTTQPTTTQVQNNVWGRIQQAPQTAIPVKLPLIIPSSTITPTSESTAPLPTVEATP